MVQELKHFTETIQSILQITPSTALIDDRKAKVYTDVVIKCKDKTFDVHRVIIASQSPFFTSKLGRWETDDRSIDMTQRQEEMEQAAMAGLSECVACHVCMCVNVYACKLVCAWLCVPVCVHACKHTCTYNYEML